MKCEDGRQEVVLVQCSTSAEKNRKTERGDKNRLNKNSEEENTNRNGKMDDRNLKWMMSACQQEQRQKESE